MLVRRGGSAGGGSAAGPDDPPTDAHSARGDCEGHQGQQGRRVAVHRKGSAYRNTPRGDLGARGGTLTPNGGGRAVALPAPMPVPFVAMDVPADGVPALRLRGVRKTFEAADEDQVPDRALRGIDLETAPGAFVAIMGPSGCGKSALLNLIAGVEAPTAAETDIAAAPRAGLADA